jgi:hypothetical protein
MLLHNTRDILGRRRQVFGWATLVMAAAALLMPTLGTAQGILERVREELKGELKDLKADVREEVAYMFGMEAYVYGYPLLMMDVTREVLTAAPASNAEGTASLLVTIYLTYRGGVTHQAGVLLWPVVAAHVVFTPLLVTAWRTERQRAHSAHHAILRDARQSRHLSRWVGGVHDPGDAPMGTEHEAAARRDHRVHLGALQRHGGSHSVQRPGCHHAGEAQAATKPLLPRGGEV